MASSSNFKNEYSYCDKPMKPIEEVKPWQDGQDYLKCRGIFINQIDAAAEMFNYTYGLVATKEFYLQHYNNVTDRWKGFLSYVIYGQADVSIVQLLAGDANLIHYAGNDMLKEPRRFIVAQYPKKLSNALAVLYPFEAKLWLIVLGVTIIMTITLRVLSGIQGKLVKGQDFTEKGVSAWWCFTVLLGENSRNETVTYHRASIRYGIPVYMGRWGCVWTIAIFRSGTKSGPHYNPTQDNSN